MSRLDHAIQIAAAAHTGQVDKAGAPYILHPLRVMMAMGSDDERIVAVLHDVVEDCPGWPLSRLTGEGFPRQVLGAIDALTRRAGEGYTAYIDRVAANPLARVVKRADLADNADLTRIQNPTDADHARTAQYMRALRQLGVPGEQPKGSEDAPASFPSSQAEAPAQAHEPRLCGVLAARSAASQI